MSPYRVTLSCYEGPIDLLLYFVHRDKLDVLDIPISQLADSFIAYVQTMDADIEELADFLLMASILLRIKMRILLRESVISDDEPIEEPVTLSRILEEFARYRETAEFLAESREGNLRHYPRGQEAKVEQTGRIEDLLRSFAILLEREKPRQALLLTRDDWTIEQATDWLHEHLSKTRKFLFFDTMRARKSSVFDMLVLFLSILEQLRLKRITLTQPEPYADFVVEAAAA